MPLLTTALQTGVMTRRRALALAATLAAGARLRPASAQAAPGPWTYAGNAARTGVYPGPGLDLDQEFTEVWRIDNGRFYVPAAVYAGTLFYAPSEVDPATNAFPPVIAVDARTGNERWRHDPPATGLLTYFLGELAIADGLLVASTSDGILLGLDAETGEERWMFDLRETARWAAPTIADGVLYAGDVTSVNAVQLGDAPEWLWKTSLGDGVTSIVSAIVSVDGDHVIATSTRPLSDANPEQKTTDIHILDRANGNELYRHEYRNGGEISQVAVGNGLIIGRVDEMYSQNPAAYFSLSIDGTEQWSTIAPPDARIHPAVDDSLVFCDTRAGLTALDAATGETVWTSPQESTLTGNLLLIDEVIYAGARDTPVISVVSAEDGTVLKTIATSVSGAQVVGITDGVLIARFGGSFRAFANPTGRA